MPRLRVWVLFPPGRLLVRDARTHVLCCSAGRRHHSGVHHQRHRRLQRHAVRHQRHGRQDHLGPAGIRRPHRLQRGAVLRARHRRNVCTAGVRGQGRAGGRAGAGGGRGGRAWTRTSPRIACVVSVCAWPWATGPPPACAVSRQQGLRTPRLCARGLPLACSRVALPPPLVRALLPAGALALRTSASASPSLRSRWTTARFCLRSTSTSRTCLCPGAGPRGAGFVSIAPRAPPALPPLECERLGPQAVQCAVGGCRACVRRVGVCECSPSLLPDGSALFIQSASSSLWRIAITSTNASNVNLTGDWSCLYTSSTCRVGPCVPAVILQGGGGGGRAGRVVAAPAHSAPLVHPPSLYCLHAPLCLALRVQPVSPPPPRRAAPQAPTASTR